MDDDAAGFPSSIGGPFSGPYTLEEGWALKRAKNLSAQSEADAEAFLKTIHPMKHAYQAYLVALENRDKLTLIWADHNEKVQAIWYIPGCQASSWDQRASSYQAIVQKGLTEWRCHVKTCVFNALIDAKSNDLDKENTKIGKDIATLTQACIGSAPTKATANLYQRIVFIRLCAWESKDKSTGKNEDAKFWKAVDTKLALYRKVTPTKEMFRISIFPSLMNKNYETDKETYGPPDSVIPITELQDMEDWLTKLHEDVSVGFTAVFKSSLNTDLVFVGPCYPKSSPVPKLTPERQLPFRMIRILRCSRLHAARTQPGGASFIVEGFHLRVETTNIAPCTASIVEPVHLGIWFYDERQQQSLDESLIPGRWCQNVADV
ncbi:hypothetical protein B0H10DRAFT_1947845 [Mycena sp. CBHHK59/15]|nr:hypothetical protein B0H10DRAFT_1947845 [Mycena sp. CBHHK59/15]